MRRTLRSVVLALVMAAMILAMAMPALAERPPFNPGVSPPPAANEPALVIFCQRQDGGTLAGFANFPVGRNFGFINSAPAPNEGFHGKGAECERTLIREEEG